jgi:hypothetical protein
MSLDLRVSRQDQRGRKGQIGKAENPIEDRGIIFSRFVLRYSFQLFSAIFDSLFVQKSANLTLTDLFKSFRCQLTQKLRNNRASLDKMLNQGHVKFHYDGRKFIIFATLAQLQLIFRHAFHQFRKLNYLFNLSKNRFRMLEMPRKRRKILASFEKIIIETLLPDLSFCDLDRVFFDLEGF